MKNKSDRLKLSVIRQLYGVDPRDIGDKESLLKENFLEEHKETIDNDSNLNISDISEHLKSKQGKNKIAENHPKKLKSYEEVASALNISAKPDEVFKAGSGHNGSQLVFNADDVRKIEEEALRDIAQNKVF